MNKALLFLLATLVAHTPCAAHERSTSELTAIAQQHFNRTVMVKAENGYVMQPVISRVADTDAMAVFQTDDNSSFVILSKSDLTDPVIGYANGEFNMTTVPTDMKWYLETVSANIRAAEARHESLSNVRQHTEIVPVEPFITTLWHQNDPFNLKTPNNYVAGCVAISMAQCINYNRYPSSVSFRGYCYYTEKASSTRYTLDSLDIKSIYFYPYLDMYGRATDSQKRSVATLVRDCGYSTLMMYNSDGSGTYSYLAGCSLVDVFQYPEESVKFESSIYCANTDHWFDIIYDEMQLRSPVIFGGQDEEFGGHSFVLCGMDEDGLVYVNWGWGGDQNGFYDITLMNPRTCQFNKSQNIIYGIRPKALPTDHVQPRIFSYDGNPYSFSLTTETDDNGKQHPTLNISVTAGLINMTPSAMDGEFGLFGTDLTTGKNWEISTTDVDTWYSGGGFMLNEPRMVFYYYVDGELTPGHTYRISFGTRDKRENQWHSILCEGGEVGYDIYYTGDPATTTISEAKEPLFDAISEVTEQKLTRTRENSFTGFFDLNGRSLRMTDDELRMTNLPKGIYIINGKKVMVK